MLYLCLIVIHSLVYGARVLQGVPETHTVFPSATFCIRISDSVDRCVQSHTAVRQLPLDSVLEEEREGKLFQLRSALTSAQNNSLQIHLFQTEACEQAVVFGEFQPLPYFTSHFGALPSQM